MTKGHMEPSHEEILASLSSILNSNHFSNSSVLRRFLTYVVNETLDGRSDRIKSYAIGIEVFGRASDFDASGDPIVRNTARRLRAALAAYYEDEGTGDAVIIRLPKGRYVPHFSFSESALPDRGREPMQKRTRPFDMLRRLRGQLAFALLGIGLIAGALVYTVAPASSDTASAITIAVAPTLALDARYTNVAASVDAHLAPEMARLGTAAITTSSARDGEDTDVPPGPIALSLRGTIGLTDGDEPVLLWRLTDRRSGVLLSASSEPLANGTQSLDIAAATQRLAFRILGENGVLTRSLSKIDGATQTRTGCLTRGQTLILVYTEDDDGALGRCLEELTTQYPQDAVAWAVLSSYYTVKSEAMGLNGQDVAALRTAAESALHRAIDLGPNTYATQVAQLYLSFCQGRIADFDAIAERLLAGFPGDAYLKVRIANRYIRLGRTDDGSVLLAQAIAQLGIHAGYEFSGLALTSYHAGRYAEAMAFLDQSGPTATTLPMLLRVAILGQLGDTEAAQRAAETASEVAPELMADFGEILRDRRWSQDIIDHIGEGIRKAGIPIESEGAPARPARFPLD